MLIEFEVNGNPFKADIDPKVRLLDVLRDDLDLISAKEGCGKGECGACTVFMDGLRVNSCLIPVFQAHKSKIFTVEGVSRWPVYQPLEKAYIEHGAVQCGFCMSGFVMSTMAYLNEVNEGLSDEDIRFALGGNLCRCTGYSKIIDAVRDLAADGELVKSVREEWKHAFGS